MSLCSCAGIAVTNTHLHTNTYTYIYTFYTHKGDTHTLISAFTPQIQFKDGEKKIHMHN